MHLCISHTRFCAHKWPGGAPQIPGSEVAYYYMVLSCDLRPDWMIGDSDTAVIDTSTSRPHFVELNGIVVGAAESQLESHVSQLPTPSLPTPSGVCLAEPSLR